MTQSESATFEYETFLEERQKPKTHSDLIAQIWAEYAARTMPAEKKETSNADNFGSGSGN